MSEFKRLSREEIANACSVECSGGLEEALEAAYREIDRLEECHCGIVNLTNPDLPYLPGVHDYNCLKGNQDLVQRYFTENKRLKARIAELEGKK